MKTYAIEGKNKLISQHLKKINQTHHIICCPYSRLAARQPNDVISVLAGPLKRCLAALICIVHPTGCTAGCVYTVTVGYTTGCKVETLC